MDQKAYQRLKDQINEDYQMRLNALEILMRPFGLTAEPKKVRGETKDIVCACCKKKFSMSMAAYRSREKSQGRPPKYCSRVCARAGIISKTNSNQEYEARLSADVLRARPVKRMKDMTKEEIEGIKAGLKKEALCT